MGRSVYFRIRNNPACFFQTIIISTANSTAGRKYKGGRHRTCNGQLLQRPHLPGCRPQGQFQQEQGPQRDRLALKFATFALSRDCGIPILFGRSTKPSGSIVPFIPWVCSFVSASWRCPLLGTSPRACGSVRTRCPSSFTGAMRVGGVNAKSLQLMAKFPRLSPVFQYDVLGVDL